MGYREGYREGTILFWQVHSNTKRSSRHKPQQEIFQYSKKGRKGIYHGYGGTLYQMSKEAMDPCRCSHLPRHCSLIQFPSGPTLSRGLDQVIWGDSQPPLQICNDPHWKPRTDIYLGSVIGSQIGTSCLCASSTYHMRWVWDNWKKKSMSDKSSKKNSLGSVLVF